MSMKPGQTKSPSASITRSAGSSTRPTAAIRPPAMPTSARYQGLPAPSITRPPRISTSSKLGLVVGREVRDELARHLRVAGEQAAVDAQHVAA